MERKAEEMREDGTESVAVDGITRQDFLKGLSTGIGGAALVGILGGNVHAAEEKIAWM